MSKFSNIFINIFYISFLTISIESMKETNTKSLLENKFLRIDETNSDENKLNDLIVNYKKKLFKFIIEDFYLDNINTITNYKEKYFSNSNEKIFNFLQKNTNPNTNFESFFNTTKFTWVEIPGISGDLPKSTKGHSMVVSDTTLVVFGGRDLDDKYYNDVHFFDFEEKSWTKVSPLGVLPTPRASHSAVLLGSTMWIFGGASDEGYFNDLFAFDLETVNKFYNKIN